MMNPTWTIPAMLPKVRPNMDAAKMIPAEVITPPVAPSPISAPRRVPTRAASSRTRVIKKML